MKQKSKNKLKTVKNIIFFIPKSMYKKAITDNEGTAIYLSPEQLNELSTIMYDCCKVKR